MKISKRIRRESIYIWILAVTLALSSAEAWGGSVSNTKHNLSRSGPGPIKATVEEGVCTFCHTPHRAIKELNLPWNLNRKLPTVNYIPYESSTLYAKVGQPTGASKFCLSCHDGTIALGALVSKPQELRFAGGIRFLPQGPAKLGTDLSDDHPVSFVYDSNLARRNLELVDPSTLPPAIRLDKNGELQCSSCHDPHDNAFGKFLKMANINSQLCTACHKKDAWEGSLHSVSNARWNEKGTNPWQHTEYHTVAENGCENCHKPHTAGGHERLLNFAFEEDNCLVCHNGNVAASNIEAEIKKRYSHPVHKYSGLHDPTEDFTLGKVPSHVECEDCHNSHQVNSTTSPGPPMVSGANRGVKGITVSGQHVGNAQNQYEICFKCHADNNVSTRLPITRKIDQLNTRLEFDPVNPSFHPVVTKGVNPEVPSLLSPYTTQSVIFCTDCHNNNSATGARGPHGSEYQFLLEQNYTTLDGTTENPSNYAICYKCHSRNSILNNQSFKEHKKHIVSEKAPCSVCHDPHGISQTQGNGVNNSHLINFDITIVKPDSQGRLLFEDLGRFAGRCFLKCHNKEHAPESYSVSQF